MKTIIILLVTIVQNVLCLESIISDLEIINVDRQIDVSSQLVKATSKLSIENKGTSGGIKTFLYAVEPTFKSLVAFVGAQVGVMWRLIVTLPYKIKLTAL